MIALTHRHVEQAAPSLGRVVDELRARRHEGNPALPLVDDELEHDADLAAARPALDAARDVVFGLLGFQILHQGVGLRRVQLPPDQRAAWLQDKSSAIIGKRLLDVFGWRLGQNVTLQGTIFPGDWTFTIRGVYTPSDAVLNDAFTPHIAELGELQAFVEDARGPATGELPVLIDDLEKALGVITTIADLLKALE